MLLQYFNNEKFEAERYDNVLKQFEQASLKTSTSLAFLNFGQNAIFSGALSLIMIMAAKQIAQGKFKIYLTMIKIVIILMKNENYIFFKWDNITIYLRKIVYL